MIARVIAQGSSDEEGNDATPANQGPASTPKLAETMASRDSDSSSDSSSDDSSDDETEQHAKTIGNKRKRDDTSNGKSNKIAKVDVSSSSDSSDDEDANKIVSSPSSKAALPDSSSEDDSSDSDSSDSDSSDSSDDEDDEKDLPNGIRRWTKLRPLHKLRQRRYGHTSASERAVAG